MQRVEEIGLKTAASIFERRYGVPIQGTKNPQEIEIEQPRTLQEWCRITIATELSKSSHSAKHLPLPVDLQQIIDDTFPGLKIEN